VRIKHLDADDVDIFRRIRLEALNREPQAFASTAADWERLSAESHARKSMVASVWTSSTGIVISGRVR
jgi:hypothetical protein